MKKRILALALAATTAFSMFGASLSVSAIDKWESGNIANFAPKTLTVDYTKADSNNDASAVFEYNGKEIDITDFVMASTYADAIEYEVSSDVPFLYDFVDESKTDWADVEAAVEAGDAVKLAKLLGVADETQTDVVIRVSKDTTYRRSFRKDLEAKFADFQKNGVIDANTIEGKDELGVKTLIGDIARADNSFASSQLIAYMQQYELYIQYAELPDLNAQIEEVQAKIDALAARSEDEFKSAREYAYFVADLDDLQAKLDVADTYSKVASVKADVIKLSTTYASKGADKNELKELLISLFNDVSITTIKTTYKTYPLNGGNKGTTAAINSADYDTDSDSWKAFATAYKNAVDVYSALASKSFQTDVDNMVAELQAAVDGLTSSSTAPNWLIVKIEELLAKAYALEESDYTKANWKTITAAIAKGEAIVEAEKPGATSAELAATALEDALKLKATDPTFTDIRALKNAITAAEKALKGLDKESNGAQYYALTAAINNAKALFKDSSLAALKDNTKKSTVNAAIDALNSAIDFSGIVLGWNKLADGSYMYGTEDGYVTSAWKWIGSSWYYFDAKGIMVTGWQQLDGAWYYFYTWGGMAKGWAQVNGTWYYLNPNGGKMLSNGWNWIDGKCYYFYSWGGMAANTTIDGYKVDASGAWVK